MTQQKTLGLYTSRGSHLSFKNQIMIDFLFLPYLTTK